MWIKNTSGKKDAMLTFAMISFFVVTFNILVATFESLTFSEWSVSFKPMDAATMPAYLAATFGAYVSRRWTTAKYSIEDEEGMGPE